MSEIRNQTNKEWRSPPESSAGVEVQAPTLLNQNTLCSCTRTQAAGRAGGAHVLDSPPYPTGAYLIMDWAQDQRQRLSEGEHRRKKQGPCFRLAHPDTSLVCSLGQHELEPDEAGQLNITESN